MADNDTPAEEDVTWSHRFSVGMEGLYDGLITGVSAVGYVVDAVNYAPSILNVLPGEQGFSNFSDRPFLGHEMIYDTLNGGYEGYKDLTGIETPELVDVTDHIVYGTGYVAGEATAIVATGGALRAGTVAATEFTAAAAGLDSTATAAAVAAADVPMTQRIGALFYDAAGESTLLGKVTGYATSATASVGKWLGGFSLRHPFLTAGAATVADIKYNDGAIVTPLAKDAADTVATKYGLAPIFGDSSNPDGGFFNDPAKLAGMGTVTLGLTAILKNVLGTPLALIVSAGIAMYFNENISNISHTFAQAVGLEDKPGTTPATPAPDAPLDAAPAAERTVVPPAPAPAPGV